MIWKKSDCLPLAVWNRTPRVDWLSEGFLGKPLFDRYKIPQLWGIFGFLCLKFETPQLFLSEQKGMLKT